MCKSCGAQWDGYEEKETDINIAIQLIDMAYRKQYERIIILTADTDICPAIVMAKSIAPEINITLAIPPASAGRNPKCSALVNAADNKCKVSFDLIHQARFAKEIALYSGKILYCPEKYR